MRIRVLRNADYRCEYRLGLRRCGLRACNVHEDMAYCAAHYELVRIGDMA